MKKRNILNTIGCLVLIVFLQTASLAQEPIPGQKDKVLEPNKPAKSALKGNIAHYYSIVLGVNQFLRVTVYQHGVDIVLAVYSPDGKMLQKTDRPNDTHGEESLSFETPAAGVYRIEVKPLSEKADEGTYVIFSELPRAATEADRKRILAEQLFLEANKLRNSDNKDLERQAITKFAETLTTWREIEDIYAEGLTLGLMARLYDEVGHPDKALETEIKALAVIRRGTDRFGEGISLLHLAKLWRARQDIDQALSYYEESLRVNGKIGEKENESESLKGAAEMLAILGAIASRHGEPAKAVAHYQRAVVYYQTLKDKAGEADLLHLVGKIYHAAGNRTEALMYYKKALVLFGEAKSGGGEERTRKDIEKINLPPPLKADLVVQTTHTSHVRSVKFSPDGKILASASFDGTIKLWDVESRRELKTIIERSVQSLAFSSDGKLLASGNWRDELIRLWDTESGRELRVFTGHRLSNVNSVAFSPDDKTLISGNNDGAIKMWDVESGKEIKSLYGHSRSVSSVVFSPDGKFIASGGDDDTVRLWDAESGKELKIFKGHDSYVNSVVFSPDGKTIASGSWDKTLKLWSVESGTEIKTFKGHEYYIQSVAFNANGKILASAGGELDVRRNELKLWDIESGKELANLKNGHTGEIESVAFSPDGKILASGGRDSLVKLWDVESRTELNKFNGDSSHSIERVNFSPDGKIIALGSQNGVISLWDLENGKELRTLNGHTESITSLAFSPDGKLLASGSEDDTIHLWEVESGKDLRVFTERARDIKSVEFSPDGRLLLSHSEDRTAQLWNAQSGELIMDFLPRFLANANAIFSPDGKILAIWGSLQRVVVLWSVETREKLLTIDAHDSYVYSVAFSPDGKTLASGSFYGDIKLWNIEDGKALRTLDEHYRAVDSLVFSRDGRTILSGSWDKTLNLWDAESGKILKSYDKKDAVTGEEFVELYPELYDFYSARFPRGKLYVRGTGNGKIKFFNKESRKELAVLIKLGKNEWVAIDPEGRFDASLGAQKLMHLVLGLEHVELEQVKDRYYTPNLLQRIFKGEDLNATRKVSVFTADELYPSAEYVPLKAGETIVRVKLKNRGGGIGRVQVFVNGAEFLADARPKGFNPRSMTGEFAVDFSSAKTLKKGELNDIKIIARNEAGWLRNRGTEIVYLDKRQKDDAPQEFYTIIGGVSEYENNAFNLSYSAKDARDFAKAVELGAAKLFGKDRVHIRLLASGTETADLTGADSKLLTPTKENFKKAFEEFRKAKPTDVFVVYLAGHGISINKGGDTGDTYLYLTQEAVTTDKLRLLDNKLRNSTTVSSEELAEWIKDVPALKRAMILDTCAAGAIEASLVKPRAFSPDQIKALDRMKDRTGFYVLMGSAADAQSYEATRYGQGLLTYSLLQGMSGAKLRDGEYADVNSLFNYAEDTVTVMATGIGGIQQPRIIAPTESRSFDIGRFSLAEKSKFKLAKVKPLILQPQLSNDIEKFDDLEISQSVAKVLRDESTNFSRAGVEARLVFAEANEMQDAITPSGVYEIIGDKIKVTLKLIINKKSVKTIIVEGNAANKEELSREIVNAVIKNAPNLDY